MFGESEAGVAEFSGATKYVFSSGLFMFLGMGTVSESRVMSHYVSS